MVKYTRTHDRAHHYIKIDYCQFWIVCTLILSIVWNVMNIFNVYWLTRHSEDVCSSRDDYGWQDAEIQLVT